MAPFRGPVSGLIIVALTRNLGFTSGEVKACEMRASTFVAKMAHNTCHFGTPRNAPRRGSLVVGARRVSTRMACEGAVYGLPALWLWIGTHADDDIIAACRSPIRLATAYATCIAI